MASKPENQVNEMKFCSDLGHPATGKMPWHLRRSAPSKVEQDRYPVHFPTTNVRRETRKTMISRVFQVTQVTSKLVSSTGTLAISERSGIYPPRDTSADCDISTSR